MIIRELKKEEINYVDTIIKWYANWWKSGRSRNEIVNKLFSDNVIINKILLDGDELIGVYQLLKKDNIEYNNSFCWLANLYIKEDKRNIGYGSKLIKDSINEAKKKGYSSLFLHSRHNGLYEKFGFVFLEEIYFNNDKKRIFKKDL